MKSTTPEQFDGSGPHRPGKRRRFAVFLPKPGPIRLSPAGLGPLALAACLGAGVFAASAQAAVSFSFNYLTPNEGFSDPVSGAERKAALNSAAGLLGSYFSGYNAALTFDVVSYAANDSTLAYASTSSYVVPGSFQPSFVQTKILSNGATDDNGAEADGVLTWNFSENWGLTNSAGADQFDFINVAMHELLHAFGFSSFIDKGGAGLDGKTPGIPDTWTVFDKFLTDAAGNRLIGADGVFNAAELAALTGGSGSVLFAGDNAKAANGGAGVSVYSPADWDPGSSITHLDDSNPDLSGLLMTAYLQPGPAAHALSAVEIAVLKDIGYSAVAAPTAVPVPAAAWLMAGGLGFIVGRRRRYFGCVARFRGGQKQGIIRRI